MRIYIATDLEGVCGVYRFDQIREQDSPANIEARRLLMAEVNAAIAGAFEGGATRVVVRDSHKDGNNFYLEDLDDRAEVIMGSFNPYDLVLQQGFDAAILLGFHAMAHTERAVLCHTHSNTQWEKYWINGKPAGELEMAGIQLGALNIPVVMVTGDDKTIAEAQGIFGQEIVTVRTKAGLGQEAALMIAPKRAQSLIRDAARKAVKVIPNLKPYRVEFPLTVRWQYTSKEIADKFQGDDLQRIDKVTIEKIVGHPEGIVRPDIGG